jgi:hypothetical protein
MLRGQKIPALQVGKDVTLLRLERGEKVLFGRDV